jgi:hypothetical protein
MAPASDSGQAGERKYLLVHPDTFELLVETFEEAQQSKQDPLIMLALKFDKKMKQIMAKGGSKQQDKVRSLVRDHTLEICELYKTAEVFVEEKSLLPEKEDQPMPKVVKKIRAAEKEDQPMPKVVKKIGAGVSVLKKRKWVSFAK